MNDHFGRRPRFNRRKTVLRSVATLLRQDFPSTACEIIVVVDGSADRITAALNQLTAPCHFRVIEQENRGLASACNSGYRTTEVLFLDDEMLCDPRLVPAHLAAHEEHAPFVTLGALFLSPASPPLTHQRVNTAGCIIAHLVRIWNLAAIGIEAGLQSATRFTRTAFPILRYTLAM